jgi:hypothetical protein
MADDTPSSSKGKGKAPADADDKVNPEDLQKVLRAMGLNADSLPGAIIGGKKQKEMDSYRFWKTQPVQSFGKSTHWNETLRVLISVQTTQRNRWIKKVRSKKSIYPKSERTRFHSTPALNGVRWT